MEIIVTSRKRIIEQTVQNLIEAGVARPCEQEMVVEQLHRLDPKDLLTALVESHVMREQCHACNFYHIGKIWEN